MNFRDDSTSRKPLAMFTQSSLTDIVLLLLIFFLLTSSFVTNLGIKVNVPRAESGAPTSEQFITVTVTKEGEFYVDGTLVAPVELSSSVSEIFRSTGKNTVVLRADKDATVEEAVRVMNIAKALNLKLLMATERASND